jgi:maltooligosyltrehalose trehalohydrolase
MLPDPTDEVAFNACRLDWHTTRAGEETRRLYTDLLALRHGDPVLSMLGAPGVVVDASAPASDIVLLRYAHGDDARLLLINLGPLIDCAMNDPLFAPAAGHRWELVFCSEQSKYGGHGVHAPADEGRWRLQAHCAWLFRLSV